MKISKRILAATAALAAVTLTACGAESAKVDDKAAETTAASSSTFEPVTITACSEEFEITEAPERIMFLNTNGVATLDALGVLDKAVGRIGDLTIDLFDEDTQAVLKDIEVVDSAMKGGGHYQISSEAVIEKDPDLLIAANPADFDVAKLREAGIAIYVADTNCPRDDMPAVGYDNIYTEVETLAKVFGIPEKGEEVIADLKADVEDVEKHIDGTELGDGAAVFVTPGDSTFYTYGRASMITPHFETVGLKNMYGTETKRVFTVSMESLLEKDPDHIVLLYQGAEEEAVRKTFEEAHGASELKAVKNGNVTTMLYPLVDPPTPLSIEGLKYLNEQLH